MDWSNLSLFLHGCCHSDFEIHIKDKSLWTNISCHGCIQPWVESLPLTLSMKSGCECFGKDDCLGTSIGAAIARILSLEDWRHEDETLGLLKAVTLCRSIQPPTERLAPLLIIDPAVQSILIRIAATRSKLPKWFVACQFATTYSANTLCYTRASRFDQVSHRDILVKDLNEYYSRVRLSHLSNAVGKKSDIWSLVWLLKYVLAGWYFLFWPGHTVFNYTHTLKARFSYSDAIKLVTSRFCLQFVVRSQTSATLRYASTFKKS